MSRDGLLLFLTRFVRLFAYGSLSVILVFYLIGLGFTSAQTGLVLTLTLAGDVFISLYLTTRADRIGRRRMLIVGAILMAAAGLTFAGTSNLFFLIVAGTVGVISPNGHDMEGVGVTRPQIADASQNSDNLLITTDRSSAIYIFATHRALRYIVMPAWCTTEVS